MKRILTVFCVLMLLTCSLAYSDTYRVISAEELKQMIEAKKQVAVVDARTEKEFREGHIPGAVSVPPEKLGSISGVLPKDKKTPVVFYCRGVG